MVTNYYEVKIIETHLHIAISNLLMQINQF